MTEQEEQKLTEQIDRLIDLRRDLERERRQILEQNDYFRMTGQLKEHNYDNRNV